MTLMAREGNHMNIDAEDLRSIMAAKAEGEYDIIDVRQPTEYERGHIPGARIIPVSEIELRLDELDPAKEHIFYCHSGKRSQAAITMIQDAGLELKAVYNLEGGMAGYQGRSLKDGPRIRLFDAAAGPVEALMQAMNLEKGASRFYASIMEALPGTSIAKAVRMLLKMEEAHARTIHHYLKKVAPEPKPAAFEKMFANLPGDVVEGGEGLDALLVKGRKIGAEGCVELSELALELEYRSYDLYRSMAARASSPESARSFFMLSEQEKAHIRVLTGLFKDCVKRK